MSKLVFLSGSHRSGKTTLAEHLAPMLKNAEPLFMNTTGMIQEAGFDMDSDVFNEIVERQKFIFFQTLERFEEYLSDGSQKIYITDRSPLDYLAYTAMIFDIGTVANVRQNERVYADAVFKTMLIRCKEFYDKYAPFFRVYVCEPLEYTTPVNGKGKPSSAAQMALHAMMVGLYSHVTGVSLASELQGKLIPSGSIAHRSVWTLHHLERDYFLSRRSFVA